MGLINTGNRSWGEYQAWLQSPEGQRAAQAENARVQAQGGYRVSSDGMVQPPPGWAQGQAQGPPAGSGGAFASSTPSWDTMAGTVSGPSTISPPPSEAVQAARREERKRQDAENLRQAQAYKPGPSYEQTRGANEAFQQQQMERLRGESMRPYRPGAAQPKQPQLDRHAGDFPMAPGLARPGQDGIPPGAIFRGIRQPQGKYAAGTSPEYMAANPDTLPYRPGAAQPKQPPSQGSPYAVLGSPAASGKYMAGVTPEYMAANPDALPPPSQGTQYGGGRQIDSGFNPGAEPRVNNFFNDPRGNWAYAAPDQRPQPFTPSSSFGGMSGTPEQMGNLRGAFVQSINNARAPQAAQWGMGNYQAPSRDFGQMMGRAQDMVKGGWQNPLQGLFGRK